MKMNKTIVAAAMASVSLLSATVFAADHPSQATVNWSGSANIIPSDIHTITGENGIMRLEDGKLTLQADGTFVSTPIVMESHKLDKTAGSTIQDQVADKVSTTWTIDSASFDWGVDNAAVVADVTKNLEFFDVNSGTTLTAGGSDKIDADSVRMTVQNKVAVSGVVNPAAMAHVEATFISTLVTP